MFTQSKEFKGDDDQGLQKAMGMDLAVARALQSSSLPTYFMALGLSTYEDRCMQETEALYKDVELQSWDKNNKTFITETRGHRQLHMSNIGPQELIKLGNHFQLSDFCEKTSPRCVKTTNTMILITSRIRAQHLPITHLTDHAELAHWTSYT